METSRGGESRRGAPPLLLLLIIAYLFVLASLLLGAISVFTQIFKKFRY